MVYLFSIFEPYCFCRTRHIISITYWMSGSCSLYDNGWFLPLGLCLSFQTTPHVPALCQTSKGAAIRLPSVWDPCFLSDSLVGTKRIFNLLSLLSWPAVACIPFFQKNSERLGIGQYMHFSFPQSPFPPCYCILSIIVYKWGNHTVQPLLIFLVRAWNGLKPQPGQHYYLQPWCAGVGKMAACFRRSLLSTWDP